MTHPCAATTVPPDRARSGRLGMVFLCFFLSGACGLVYEVVWIRMMVLTIGSTVFAVSAVVT